MNTIYCASDGFMLECREVKANRQPESSGMVYLGTGACSAPVIGASSGWIEGALVDGETGIVLNPYDAEEIARATFRLLTDGELALPPWSDGRRRARTRVQLGGDRRRLEDRLRHATGGIMKKAFFHFTRPVRYSYMLAKMFALAGYDVRFDTDIKPHPISPESRQQLGSELYNFNYVFHDSTIIQDANCRSPEEYVCFFDIAPRMSAVFMKRGWRHIVSYSVLFNGLLTRRRPIHRQPRGWIMFTARYLLDLELPKWKFPIVVRKHLRFSVHPMERCLSPTARFFSPNHTLHPYLLREEGTLNRLPDLRGSARRCRVFFAGGYSLPHRQKQMNVIIEYFAEKEGILLATTIEELDGVLRHGSASLPVCIMAENSWIQKREWLDYLSKCDFTLCPSGYMTRTHRSVEALSVGSIPIIQGSDSFYPALENRVNCLVYRNEKDVVEAIEQAVQMSPQEIDRMRRSALDYYDTYLRPDTYVDHILRGLQVS